MTFTSTCCGKSIRIIFSLVLFSFFFAATFPKTAPAVMDQSNRFDGGMPIAALLCSILLGPLGIQGWIVNVDSPDYGEFARHQRRVSIALHIVVALFAISIAIAAGEIVSSDAGGATSWALIAYVCAVALSILTAISFVLSVVIVIKYVNRPARRRSQAA